jgi:hypothetical protein
MTLPRAYMAAKVKIAQFVHDNNCCDENGIPCPLKMPTQIEMHPAVYMSLLASIEGSDSIDFREDGAYMMDVKLVENDRVPGIEMLVS